MSLDYILICYIVIGLGSDGCPWRKYSSHGCRNDDGKLSNNYSYGNSHYISLCLFVIHTISHCVAFVTVGGVRDRTATLAVLVVNTYIVLSGLKSAPHAGIRVLKQHGSRTPKPKCEDDAPQGSEHAASSLPVRLLSMIDDRLAAPRRERISLFRVATCSGGTTHGKRKAINRKWEGVYNADAKFQISQMNGKHPMRKVLHMQSCYPTTIRRLSDKLSTISNVAPDGTKYTDSRHPKATAAVSSASGRRPRYLPSSSSSKNKTYPSPTTASAAPATAAPSQGRSPLTTGRSSRSGSTSRLASIKRCGRESKEMRRRAIQEEYSFCHGKMRYNRARGRGAEVNGIITGNAPLEVKMPLFPARATHQQLLGLVHRPSHPDKPAPEVPREKKWLGDSVGWEGS